MLSSKKILYLIILSLIVICGVNGIDYYAGAYEHSGDFSDEIITFSDSGFFKAPEGTGTVSIVSEGESVSDQYEVGDIYVQSNTTTSIDHEVVDLPENVTTTTSTENITNGQTETTAPQPSNTETSHYEESTATAFSTTTTTTFSTTTTTTTTTTEPTTTTTTRWYNDSGSVHFEHSTIRIYAGASVNVSLSFPIGAQRRASFVSRDPSVVTVSNYDDTTVVITGLSVGTGWIQATSSSGDTAYCRVIVTNFAEEVIRLTNVKRAEYGLPELTAAGPLVQAVADLRLSECSSYFSHTRPNGTKFSTAASDIGLTYLKIGENLASGQTSPEEVIDDWMASPSHKANILDGDYTQICVSYGIGSDGVPYWTQIFFKPIA